MKRMMSVALLMAGCSGGGHGSVGAPNLTMLNGNPGSTAVTPASSNTALFHPAAALYTPSNLQTLRDDFARIPELLALEPPPQPDVTTASA